MQSLILADTHTGPTVYRRDRLGQAKGNKHVSAAFIHLSHIYSVSSVPGTALCAGDTDVTSNFSWGLYSSGHC